MSSDFMGKLFALLCAILWATAVILFKKSGEKTSPTALNLFKSVVAVVFVFPLFLIEDVSSNIVQTDWAELWLLIISGIIGIAIADSLFFKSLNMIGAGLTAIVDCSYSPMTILLSYLFLSERISISMIGGSLLVALAVVIGAYQKGNRGLDLLNTVKGIILGLLAIFFILTSVILMKPVLETKSIFFVTEIRLVAGLIGIGLIISFRKNRKQIFKSAFDRTNFKYAFPAAFLGNVLSMTFWIAAFKLTNINSAAILNQTNTIFIIIMASLFLKEIFTVRKLIATMLAIGGSLIVILA